eukprot:CAMPEP_0119301956 /NCGR_PEP_ID=MMETSP1333-20130426/3654_1 /TAXON_ID=418940 /ORGANISM="Scyphosphaera apsteinii, Strain RCC1455" /LENGTH=488 /DNA_ID=CAMNT_0007304179 /DNA_START=26 /DNA_END=1489 /DNA_ORIENTATION=+
MAVQRVNAAVAASDLTPIRVVDESSPLIACRQADSLTLAVKLGYGLPALAHFGFHIPVNVFAEKFYADVLLLRVEQIATGLAVGSLFDATLGVLIGWLSDNFQAHIGAKRRHPFIAIGAVLASVALMALLSPPVYDLPDHTWLHFTLSYMFVHLGISLFIIPYISLGYEITRTYDEASSLFALRQVLGLIGILLAAALPSVIKLSLPAAVSSERMAFRFEGVMLAALMLTCVGALLLLVTERAGSRASHALLPGLLWALNNRANLYLLPVWLFASIGTSSSLAMLPFWVEYVLQPPVVRRERWLLAILCSSILASIVAIPLWAWFAHHSSKKAAALTSWIASIISSMLALPIGPGQIELAVASWVLIGASVSGWNFLFFALQADVVDYDELHTGMRREAAYASLELLLPKLLGVTSHGLPLTIIGMAGYAPNKIQAPAALWAIRLLVSLTPLLCSVFVLPCLVLFPISREVHHLIAHGIKQHTRGEAA